MNFSRCVSVIMLFIVAHLSAMDTRQNITQAILLEGGRNTQLQMGRYFIQTHPDVVTWLRQLCFSRPIISEKLTNSEKFESVTTSPDGKFIASCSRTGVELCAVNGNYLKKLTTDPELGVTVGWVTAVAWSPDGNHLTSGSAHGTICIWDVASGTCLKELISNTGKVISIAWSLDGKSLVSDSENNDVRLWHLPDICLLDVAIDSLSIAQQSFIISLHKIQQRHHRPLVILPGTHARATFETLPNCLQQLLFDNQCVQLDYSLIQQTRQAVASFVQNHSTALASSALALLGIYLS